MILSTWAKGYPVHHTYIQVAKDLTAEIGHLHPRQVTPFLCESILAKWRSRLSQSTLFVRRAAFQQCIGVLSQFGGPVFKLPKVRKPAPRGVVATQEQIAKLLAAAKPAMRLFILLCWQLGLRHSEALAVTPSSYDKDTQTITIRVKGGKLRRIPLTADTEEMIRAAVAAAPDPTEPCVSIFNNKRVTRLEKQWWTLCKKAGVQGIRPHDLRRTVLTDLYNKTHDIRAVQQYAGHSQLVSTTHYLAPLAEEQLRQMHTLLNFHSKVKQ